MPKISVIIPAYNSEKWIAETLDNMLAQSLKDIEVIIINDGSTDDTQAVIDEYVKKSSIFKSYIQENAGVSAARNNGLSKATGEYVVFQDADDLYSDTSLEAFYNCAEKNGADVVIGRLRTFSEKGFGKFNAFADKLAQMDDIKPYDITLLWNFLVGNKCYRRERLVNSGIVFPPYRYSEEGAFFMSYVYTEPKISGTMGSELYYRRHSKEEGLSVSQTVTTALAKSFSQSLGMIYKNALKYVENTKDEFDKDEYIQEVIYKDAYVLLSQFYRLMWHGDEEVASYCAEEFERLRSLMTERRFEIIKGTDRDLHLDKIAKSRKEVAENPYVSVIVKKCGKRDMGGFFHSLYAQLTPMFEVIVPESMVNEGRVPEEYLSCENHVVLPDKGFMKKAKRAAKSKRRVVFAIPVRLDIRVLKLIYKVPVPERIRDMFFSLLVKMLNFVLVKRIIK